MVIPAQNNTWAQGHVDPWWGLRHRDFDYKNEQFNDLSSLAEWRRLGYTQSRFTGDMYDMRSSEPGWVDGFRNIFPFERFSWSFYRMPPGSVLPAHRDTYDRFKLIHGLETTHSVVRTIVFLEDWDSGHYLELNGNPFTGWRAGDWVSWHDDFLHLAANMGRTDRYTLQLTGTV
jgi:Aspartyl/Asparaginyl beta-hydroxylase